MMDKKQQIEMILEKGRQHFLAEMKGKLDRALYDLMNSCLNKNELDYTEIRRFFHTIAGTAGTLQFKSLSSTALYYESYMDDRSFDVLDSNDFHILLTGLAKLSREMKTLTDKYLQMPDMSVSGDNQDGSYTTLANTANVLIVDDDVALLNMLDRVFKTEGFSAAITSRPEEVTEILSKKSFDLVILDIMMPNIDGFEVYRRIRSGFSDIPVIFLTAKSYKDDRIKALKSGVDDYIIKPFETEELLARAEAIIMKSTRSKKYMITDVLTGVYTKKFFNDDFREFKARFSRKNEMFSVCFMDLDHFKEINDTYGHLVGDNVLKDFVKHLKDCLRVTDHIFRFGGDEFLILMPDTDAKTAYNVVERIRDKLQAKELMYENMKQALRLSFSAGIADYRNVSETPEQLLERADKGLYMSKDAGRGKTSIYHESHSIRNSGRKRIFIIDDNDVIIRLVKTRLDALDYEVSYANDGEKGLEMISSFHPDVLIVDIMLPGINGFEVCKRAKEILKDVNFKLIVMSSLKDAKTLEKCVQLGVDQHVSKPFSLTDIEVAIQKLLR